MQGLARSEIPTDEAAWTCSKTTTTQNGSNDPAVWKIVGRKLKNLKNYNWNLCSDTLTDAWGILKNENNLEKLEMFTSRICILNPLTPGKSGSLFHPRQDKLTYQSNRFEAPMGEMCFYKKILEEEKLQSDLESSF